MRKSLIAMAAVAALGAATMTGAMAGPPGGGHGGGGGMGHGGGGGGMSHAMSGGMGHAMSSGGMGAASGGMRANIGGGNIDRPAVAGTNISGAANVGQANVGRANVGTANFATMHGTNAGRGRYADRDHDRHGRRDGRFGVGLYAFSGPDYYDYYDSDTDSDNCYQRRLVRTPFGLRWRTIDICD